ncbi:MAG TPA: prepilin-type N-terminal cleavage/methylation domain-containing protein [Thermoanaerobaculia bacterium]|nr:prepilin-type N-terminal cleavage/methylation domain-containing protein [Thermoanaerobaculia bacterium]
MHNEHRLRSGERGYNLVEVLIAMALMGTVLMSIMGLFYFGRRNVYSGKEMTEAVAVGTHVLEDLNTMTKDGVVFAFVLPAGVGTANTVGGQSFPNSFVRTTTNISAATDASGFLQRWQDEMVNNSKFQNGVISIVFTPTADGTNAPPQMATSTVIKMRVFVEWGEAIRRRQVVLDSVKIERQ